MELRSTSVQEQELLLSSDVNFSQIAYFMGAVIALSGMIVFVGLNWAKIGFIPRLFVTLGTGVVAYGAAVVLLVRQRLLTAGFMLSILAAVSFLAGIALILDKLGYPFFVEGMKHGLGGTYFNFLIMFGVMSLLFIASFVWFRKSAFLLLSIAFITWFFFTLTGWFFPDSYNAHRYFGIAQGLLYIPLAYQISKTRYASLTGIMYFFGVLSVLTSMLGSYGLGKRSHVLVWDCLYPVALAACLWLGNKIGQRSLIKLTGIFTVVYVVDISQRYFKSSLSWPLVLVVAGLAIVALVYIQEKYFVKK